MRKAKAAYHHGNLAEALLAEAVRQVERTGAEAFSLREAAAALGVTANAAYRHFADKRALLGAVADTGFELLAQKMTDATEKTASPGHGPAEAARLRLKATGRAYVEFAFAHPELFRLLSGPLGLDAQRKAQRRAENVVGPYELLSERLDELVTSGALERERRAGAELKAWTVVHGFASLALGGEASLREPGAREAALDGVLDFALLGLGASGTVGKTQRSGKPARVSP